MGWEEYYQHERVISFSDHETGYRHAIDYLLGNNPEAENIGRRPNIVLGGFFPHQRTFGSFVNFCRDTFGGLDPNLIAFDMNVKPLKFAKKSNIGEVSFVQGDLTRFPFSPKTIDFLFLDCTAEFISPDNLNRLSSNLAIALKPNGLVLSAIHSPLFAPFDKMFSSFKHRVHCYTYQPNQVRKHLGFSLKICYESDYRCYTLPKSTTCDVQAFCRNEACYPVFRGMPIGVNV